MNLPNKLTFARIIMIPVFAVLYFAPFAWHAVAATAVFCVACITDFFDGYIARKQNLITHLGKFLDPIADKLLVACALIALCVSEPAASPAYALGLCVTAFTMIILCRELLVSGFRIIAADRRVVLAADKVGKAKTFTQMVALLLLLPVGDYAAVNATAASIVYYIGFAVLAVATVLTIVSGINYFVKNKSVLKEPTAFDIRNAEEEAVAAIKVAADAETTVKAEAETQADNADNGNGELYKQ